jgi:LysM repeat protein
MNNLRQLFVGLVTALSSSLLVLAAVSLALAEGGLSPTLPVLSSEVTATLANPVLDLTPQPTQPASAAATQPPVEPTRCMLPEGWTHYTIQSGDSLEGLAAQTSLSVEDLSKANCLRSTSLPVGADFYLPVVITTPTEQPPEPLPTLPPPPATATATPIPFTCSAPPAGWIIHIVQAGENLYRLGAAYGITAGYLQQVNCLNSTNIVTGQRLYVPNVPTRTPVFKATATPQPKNTDTSVPPTATATEIPTEIPTIAPTQTIETPSTPQATITDSTPPGNSGVTTPVPATQAVTPVLETPIPVGTPPATQ